MVALLNSGGYFACFRALVLRGFEGLILSDALLRA